MVLFSFKTHFKKFSQVLFIPQPFLCYKIGSKWFLNRFLQGRALIAPPPSRCPFLRPLLVGLTYIFNPSSSRVNPCMFLPVEQGSNQPWLGCLQHSMNQPYLYNIHSCHFQGCTRGGQRDNFLANNVSDMFFKLIQLV